MGEASEEMTIEIQVSETRDLFLCEKIADIEYKGQEATLRRSIPGSDLILRVDDKCYIVSASSVCVAILDKLKE